MPYNMYVQLYIIQNAAINNTYPAILNLYLTQFERNTNFYCLVNCNNLYHFKCQGINCMNVLWLYDDVWINDLCINPLCLLGDFMDATRYFGHPPFIVILEEINCDLVKRSE